MVVSNFWKRYPLLRHLFGSRKTEECGRFLNGSVHVDPLSCGRVIELGRIDVERVWVISSRFCQLTWQASRSYPNVEFTAPYLRFLCRMGLIATLDTYFLQPVVNRDD